MMKKLRAFAIYASIAIVIFAILQFVWGCGSYNECELARRLGLDKHPQYQEQYFEKCGCGDKQ
jgi:hypothetical protein